MNKYIKKNKHFRYLYNKLELSYFYAQYFNKFKNVNNFYISKNLELLHIKLLHIKVIGKYRSRIYNCCIFTGRSNSVYKKYRVNRVLLRNLISTGKLSGIRKSSW